MPQQEDVILCDAVGRQKPRPATGEENVTCMILVDGDPAEFTSRAETDGRRRGSRYWFGNELSHKSGRDNLHTYAAAEFIVIIFPITGACCVV